MSKKLTDDELMWCDWFETLSLDLQQRYVAHEPFVEGAKRERARIRRELLRRFIEARTSGPGEGGFITAEGYCKGLDMATSILITVCSEED